MKLLIFFFSLIFSIVGFSQKETTRKNSYDLIVKINGLGRNYVGCGVRSYSISVLGQVQNQFDKNRFGDEVMLVFNCPARLNTLPPGNMYKLKVVFYDSITVDRNTDIPAKDTLFRKTLIVRDVKVFMPLQISSLNSFIPFFSSLVILPKQVLQTKTARLQII